MKVSSIQWQNVINNLMFEMLPQGVISFTHPDGTPFQLQFVANALGGYQPQSDALPVAPAFPHPIPEFVLEQIRFGREQAANRPLDAARGDYVGYVQYSK